MQKQPKYTFDILIRSETKRKNFFKQINRIISGLRDEGFYEAASYMIDQRDRLQAKINRLIAA
ncbi:hypothetical protein B5K06_12270 [Rhizobium grahamii]|uniref:Uncharacterized protein n=1 Tax=Rhizobium grahamii TaxID=1120045 RepID=A0A370KQI5_9HYPH|nr:hypothetical protein B5K06_12270 [Rhizobium grahamii]